MNVMRRKGLFLACAIVLTRNRWHVIVGTATVWGGKAVLKDGAGVGRLEIKVEVHTTKDQHASLSRWSRQESHGI
ncbi:hypothetical protein VNO80_15742 [Phaseolus coccineus]|uniref:Uncharacterized protein n=1 Tax=Phaseolus coccineus TaxID=3886 RepID=A0AAN9MKV3_PHACN